MEKFSDKLISWKHGILQENVASHFEPIQNITKTTKLKKPKRFTDLIQGTFFFYIQESEYFPEIWFSSYLCEIMNGKLQAIQWWKENE